MRYFKNIAKLIKEKRVSHLKQYSQSDLSHMLGYKNGQFISNVERGLCSIPMKMLSKVSNILDIEIDELKSTLLKDHEKTLEYFLFLGSDLNDDTNSNSNSNFDSDSDSEVTDELTIIIPPLPTKEST